MTHEPFDVLVVGAGPGGIAAAITAAEHARVGVVDDNPHSGGQIWRGGESQAHDRRGATVLNLFASSKAELIASTQVVAATEPGLLLAECDGQPIELRYRKLILATGARERFLPFPGWTLPNVMGAGGLQALVKSGFPVKGRRVIVAGSGPLLLSVAEYLQRQGATVPLVAEQASWPRVAAFGAKLVWLNFGKLLEGARYRMALRNARYTPGTWPTNAHGTAKLEAVTFRSGSKTWTEPCDILACGFGLVPNLELPQLLGCEVRDGAVVVDEWQESTVPGVYCVGELTGIGGAESALVEGFIAGDSAVGDRKRAIDRFAIRARHRRFAKALNHAFALRDELRNLVDDDTLICRCEDVTRAKLAGYASWRAAKLHTRCGMGPCQGRVCGPAAEFLFGWKHESIRPPLFPATAATLAHETENENDG